MTTTRAMDSAAQDGRILRGNRTREKLLSAAIELFGSRGFDSTSMKDLAAAAGVQAPAIYNHFSSKESILVAATTWALTDFHQAVVGADDASQPPRDRLAGLVRRHVIYQLEHVQLAKANDLVMDADALQHLLPPDVHSDIRALMRRHLDLVTDIIGELASPSSNVPPPRLCALAVLSLCDRVLSWYRPDGHFSMEEVADYYWVLVQGMLRLKAPRRR